MKKDYLKADELLNEAFKALKRARIPYVIPEAVREEAKKRLSQIRVASLYESLTDLINIDGNINRSLDNVISLLKETRTDLVFRAWWRWRPLPESLNDTFFTSEQLEEYRRIGYSITYENLRNATTKIKKYLPDVIICGAVGAQFISAKKDRNEITGRIFYQNETWDMALDPSKWGLPMSKRDFLAATYGRRVLVEEFLQNFYYPDITNHEFQNLLISWAQKQIDYGIDAIWFDLLYAQAGILAGEYAIIPGIPKDPYHKAVKDSYEAASLVIDEIHNYGYIKYKKYIYVGTWAYPAVALPYSPPRLDFVTCSPSPSEVLEGKLDETKWDRQFREVREKFGEIPIFVFVDWGIGTSTPLGVFSQRLTKEEQARFLRVADEFFQSKGVIFVYPLHGGYMGGQAAVLSFGRFKFYDSLAHEFRTYETIKELAQNKKKD